MTGRLSRAWIAPCLALLALFALATWVSTSFTILDADVIACSVACVLLVVPLGILAGRARSRRRFVVWSAIVIAVFAVALVLVLQSRRNVVVWPKDVAWALGLAGLFAIVAPASVGDLEHASLQRAAITVIVVAPFVAIPTTPTLFFWVAPLGVLVGGVIVFRVIALERRRLVTSDEVPTASRPRLVMIATTVVTVTGALGVVGAIATAPAISTPSAIRSFYGKGTMYRLEDTAIPNLSIYWVVTFEPHYHRQNVGWDRKHRVLVSAKDVFVRLPHDDADRAAADAISYLVGNEEAFAVANRTKRNGNEISFVYTTYRSRHGHATTVDLATGTLGPETTIDLDYNDSTGSMGTPNTNGRNTYRGY